MTKIITILVSMVALNSYSQMVVTDAGATAALSTANTTMSTTLAKSAATLKQLEDSYKLLQKGAEKIEKVNSMVKSVNDIKEIIGFQKEAITNINLIKSNMKDKKNATATLKTLNNILSTLTRSIGDINNILKDSFFSMTDKERIDTFNEKRSIVLLNTIKTRAMANKYK